ncbi:MAG: amidohydrolase family protein, partial [Clostridia bacterium]|nr:amidohydrolase family protein [Clostridia bacterium]
MKKLLKKIDVHAHVVLFQEYEFSKVFTMTPEKLLSIYDEIGVDKGILLPILSPEAQSAMVLSNGAARATVEKYPDRFYWFCNVDPRCLDNSDHTDFSAVLSFFRDLGAKGMGELTANLYADDPQMDNLFSYCAAAGLPVTIHVGPTLGGCYGIVDDLGLPRIEKMLRKHPDLKIFGHSQPFWAEIDAGVNAANRNTYPQGRVTEGRLAKLMRDYPNLYCDMSAGSCYNAMTRDPDYAYRFIEEFGSRMMYAIDACHPDNLQIRKMGRWLDESYEQGYISENNYRGICRENA